MTENNKPQSIQYHAFFKDQMLLTDNEVTISFIKFMIGIAILNFPSQSNRLGVLNGLISTALMCGLVMISNHNLVKAIPLELMNQNLTLG